MQTVALGLREGKAQQRQNVWGRREGKEDTAVGLYQGESVSRLAMLSYKGQSLSSLRTPEPGPLWAPEEPLSLPTPPSPSTGSHVGPSPYGARNKEWLLVSWNRGVVRGRGRFRFLVELDKERGNRAPQLPMSLSPPGRILANVHVRASEVACGWKNQQGMLQVLCRSRGLGRDFCLWKIKIAFPLLSHLKGTLNEYLIWSQDLPNH